MAVTARISNNCLAAAQIQLSAKSGITAGTSIDSTSSDQALLHKLHTVTGIKYCRFREHTAKANSIPVSNSRRDLSRTLSYRHDLLKYFRHTKNPVFHY